MKIIKVDNYAREHIADHLIAENLNDYWGNYIVELLNSRQHEDSDNYFRLVEDNHVLWRGMEELI
ncbi:hypothetical protein BC351_00980 [Paenibacillus ferrarius]|uniref:Uncharacterized protein n=1 Tax=Paenibacillus ferrarius TaxID=1469647 RepID=A0A1V4HSJ7_9BACL|nr:hypothetical protein [Paenibacillus ferrarius]OPH61846.1 hypothetical protein BC351_00980 [Paenibacillus ferrarius]